MLHIITVETLPDPRRGVLDPMAFRINDGLDDLVRALDARGIAYDLKQTPEPWEQWQLFFKGPIGERVKVDCEGLF